jgi:transposase InsO family protein
MHRDSDNLLVCVPSWQRNLILRVMHDLPLGIHQGTAKMYALMAARFYFPKMEERVRAYVETCAHCQRNKAYTRNTRDIPRPSEVPFCRFDVVALDIVSGFSTTKTGFDAIVVFTDCLTKRVYIESCTKTASARDLALIFFHTVFRSQGMPRTLVADNGPQFTSEFWTEFFSLLQTDIRLTSSYHPQSNGQTEPFNQTLIEALLSFVNARHDNWDQFLVHFEFAYNSTLNDSTGFSPFILQFVQAPRAPWDSVLEGGECGNAFFHRTTNAAGKIEPDNWPTNAAGKIEPDNWPVVRLDFPGCISSPMEKRVPTKTIWEAVGSWFPALRIRFFTRTLRALSSHGSGLTWICRLTMSA